METFSDYSHRRQVYDGAAPEAVIESLKTLPSGASVLDVGCGDGSLLDALHTTRADLHYAGVDMSEERLDLLKRAHPYIAARKDNAETLDSVESGKIDFLISTQVIEHVDDRSMLRNVARALRPDGRAYVSTVWKRKYAFYFYRAGDRWALDPTHLREYEGDEELLSIVRSVGLRVEAARKTPIAYPLADPVVKRFFRGRRIPQWVERARSVRVRIPGYYLWELELKKSSDA